MKKSVIAHNLFSYNSPCKAISFEISWLGYPLMEHVCNALYIAADQVKVEIKQNEKGQGEMVLDAILHEDTVTQEDGFDSQGKYD